MLGLNRKDENNKKKQNPIQIVINACAWFVCVFLFLFPLIYGINFGSILITLVAIAALPIEPIRNIWRSVFKTKLVPLIKVGILFVVFMVSIFFLPEIENNTGEPNDTQISIGSENLETQSEFESEIGDVIAGNTETESELVSESEVELESQSESASESEKESESESESTKPSNPSKPSTPSKLPTIPSISASSIPAYSGKAYVALNNNKPHFETKDLAPVSYEYYSDLDSLGRCGVVYACIGQDIMPTEERGNIGSVKPTGWHTVKYDIVDGKYLYNRCHLIGYQLSAENANTKNLITGTRQLNVEGMLPFENMVADYVKETNNHVMYRVTPVFDGNNLVATGVQMEAWSIEDNGVGICFNVFVYNVQDGIEINYANGDSSLVETQPSESEKPAPTPTPEPEPEEDEGSLSMVWIPTKGGTKYHSKSSCSGMKEPRQVTEEEAIEEGFTKCSRCW